MSVYEQTFTVTNRANEKIAGVLNATQKPSPGDPVTILCHGYTASKNTPLLCAVSSGLLHALPTSHAVIRFDFSGNGDSEGTFKYSNYRDEAEDLRAVVQHTRSDLHLNVICVLGHSKGASVVLLYAEKYYDVPCVINLAGRFQMTRGLRERFGEDAMRAMEEGKTHIVRTTRRDGTGKRVPLEFGMTIEQVRERCAIDMASVVEHLAPDTFVRTIHGDKDAVIPSEDGVAINERIKNGDIVILPEADHVFAGFEQDVVDAVATVVRRVTGAVKAS